MGRSRRQSKLYVDALLELTLLLHLVVSIVPASGAACYPAIFAFGDSLSDNGNALRTGNPTFFTITLPPYGKTFFKRPALRYSDGRLVIDLLAQSLGLPFLNPYLAYKNPDKDFSNGANYAVAGGTVQGSGMLLESGVFNLFTADNLQVQLGWHLKLKSLASKRSREGARLPSPEAFSKGLYFFEIGGNDYGSTFLSERYFDRRPEITLAKSKALGLVATVVRKLVNAIETLYANEARNFILLSIPPEGCVAVYIKLLNGTNDRYGCVEEINEVDQVHNQQLSTALQALRDKYADLNIIEADYHTVYQNVVQNPSAYGFKEPISACCGAGPDVPYQFKLLKICRPGVYVCPDPSSYVSWDGIHQTDGFNRFVVNQFVTGNNINPPDALACATPVAN